jgi:four helix bundle protein
VYGRARGGRVAAGEGMVVREEGPGTGDQEPGPMRRKIRDYRDLTVWQRAMALVVECYSATYLFPKSELYGLSSQLQRAAVSVPSNIAEGNGRTSLGDYLRHLSIANGSLMELETHIHVARRLAYLDGAQESRLLRLSSEVGRMLASLTVQIRRKKSAGRLPGSWSPVPGP